MGWLFNSIWQKAEVGLINPAFGTPPKMRRSTVRTTCSFVATAPVGRLASERGLPAPIGTQDDDN